ncbi:hypothetical protein Tco_0251671 [Tanacetum coccineum]
MTQFAISKEKASNVIFEGTEQYFEIQDLKAQLQDKNIAIRNYKQKTSKAWKWWIAQQCPSAYKWVPKTNMKWVPKVRNEIVPKRVSYAIDTVSRITKVLKITNALGSNLSCIPSSSNSLADCTTHPIQLFDSGLHKAHDGPNLSLCVILLKNSWEPFVLARTICPILGMQIWFKEISTIKRVYYVEGLNHNLFLVGQFCDADLEVAFWKSTCFVRDLQGNDLLTGNRGTDLYTISL